MMMGVCPTICVSSGSERQPTEDCHPKEVVQPSIGKQKTVSSFVMKNEHSILNDPHYGNGDKSGRPMVEVKHCGKNDDR
jgi:hypothetical protein